MKKIINSLTKATLATLMLLATNGYANEPQSEATSQLPQLIVCELLNNCEITE